MKNNKISKVLQAMKVFFLSSILLLSLISIEKTNYSELYPAPFVHYILPSGEVIYSSPLGTYLIRNGKVIYSEKIKYEFKSNSSPVKMRSGIERFDDTQKLPVKTEYKINFKFSEYLKSQPVTLATVSVIARKKAEKILNLRLTQQLEQNELQGEQWYRDSKGWLKIAFCNPVHYKHPNNELIVLERNMKNIFPHIANYTQIHYGIGAGETELEIIRWQLESGRDVHISAIDVNSDFLDIFASNLSAKQLEYQGQNIQCKFINTVFQNLDKKQFIDNVSKSVHICVGNTIGNFRNQSEIFSIFRDNTKFGDKLILGFQLDTHIDVTLEKYRTNPYYPNFVLNQLVKNNAIDLGKIRWNYEPESGFITMNYGNIEVFRSKKYKTLNLQNELSSFSFKYIGHWKDEYKNSEIMLLERT